MKFSFYLPINCIKCVSLLLKFKNQIEAKSTNVVAIEIEHRFELEPTFACICSHCRNRLLDLLLSFAQRTNAVFNKSVCVIFLFFFFFFLLFDLALYLLGFDRFHSLQPPHMCIEFIVCVCVCVTVVVNFASIATFQIQFQFLQMIHSPDHIFRVVLMRGNDRIS